MLAVKTRSAARRSQAATEADVPTAMDVAASNGFATSEQLLGARQPDGQGGVQGLGVTSTHTVSTAPPGMAAGAGVLEVEAAPLLERGRTAGQAQRLDMDGAAAPLVISADIAFSALLVLPLIAWWSCVGVGMAAYEGLGKAKRVYHVMQWFDQLVLRPAGPLLPFYVLGARVVTHAAAHWASSSSSSGWRIEQVHLGTLVLPCLRRYALIAAVRLAVYLALLGAVRARLLAKDLVSDHIFLAASMVVCLQAEACCLLSDVVRCIRREVSAQEVVLTGCFVCCLFLYLFTAADMFFTAKYYHPPAESFGSTLAAFAAFQAPLLLWLKRSRQVV